jgi:hypothetical protein
MSLGINVQSRHPGPSFSTYLFDLGSTVHFSRTRPQAATWLSRTAHRCGEMLFLGRFDEHRETQILRGVLTRPSRREQIGRAIAVGTRLTRKGAVRV